MKYCSNFVLNLNRKEMKVEINESRKVKEREFPKLMKAEKYNRIILATGIIDNSRIKGFLIRSEDISDNLHFSNYWDINSFTDFEGSITLSND